MHGDIDTLRVDVKEQRRLNELQTFIHERC